MKTLFFAILTINMLHLGASAQTIDTDEINREAQTQVDSARNQDPSADDGGFEKFVKAVGNHIANGLQPAQKILTSDRKLTLADQSKIELVKCVSKVLDKNRGGGQAPAVAYLMLSRAVDQNGWIDDDSIIKNAATACNEERSKLHSYADRKITEAMRTEALQNLVVNNAATSKIKSLIVKLYDKTVVDCQVSTTKVSAAFVLGAQVGASHYKCLYSDGRVRKFFGPMIGLDIGFSASLTQNITRAHDSQKAHPKSPFHVYSPDPDRTQNEFVTGIGSFKISQMKDLKEKKGFAVGAGSAIGFEGHFMFRIWNAKRHWGMLIDQLN